MGFPIWPYTNFHDLNADWILCQIREFKTELEAMSDTILGNSDKMTQLQTDLDNLENTVNDIISGKYADEMIPGIENWINENLQKFVSNIVKYVFFGLSMDGHFVAYIPKTWNFITFDTIVDSSSPLYGHLILKW